jgi:hypothetical protein
MTKHHGTCHCGAVAFEAELDLAVVSHCNCTICTKTMWTGAMCKPEQFRLVRGEPELSSYAWGAKISTRYFCTRCGVQCFARGHLAVLGGDYVSINVACLDDVDVFALPERHWDGRHDNWRVGPRDTPYPIA